MSCETCKSHTPNLDEATVAVKKASEITQVYDRQNRRLWIAIIVLAASMVVMAGCMVWAVTNAQRLANDAMWNALNTVAEMEVTQETTTTQTIEGDSAIINNADFEQYNDNAVNGGGN